VYSTYLKDLLVNAARPMCLLFSFFIFIFVVLCSNQCVFPSFFLCFYRQDREPDHCEPSFWVVFEPHFVVGKLVLYFSLLSFFLIHVRYTSLNSQLNNDHNCSFNFSKQFYSYLLFLYVFYILTACNHHSWPFRRRWISLTLPSVSRDTLVVASNCILTPR